MTGNKWQAGAEIFLGVKRGMKKGPEADGGGPSALLHLALPSFFFSPPLSSRGDAVLGLWVRGVQEARAGPEGTQAAPGKVQIRSQGPGSHVALGERRVCQPSGIERECA